MIDPLSYDPEDAYYGPLGEFARRHREQISVNLAAFYAMLLPAIGSLIGRRAMIAVSRDSHFPNLFTAVVGATGCGKGMSWCIIEDILKRIDPSCATRIHSDCASGPGLISLVCDPRERTVNDKVIKIRGVSDKRCLVIFEEMDNLFTAMSRKGSTLDKVLNMAYDSRSLENRPRDGGEKATDPHISTVCHITPEAFRDAVSRVSNGLGCSNGFFNRFITVQAVRERSLPRGGIMPPVDDLVEQIREALAALDGPDKAVITWHESTHAPWDAFVDALDGEHPFLDGLGGLAARLKPNVMRVAMILAVIDRAREIMPWHLKAAKSFCLQCIDSSRHLFGNRSKQERPNALRARVLKVLDDEPKTLTQLHNCLQKKGYTGSELRQVLAELTAEGSAQVSMVATGRRTHAEAWSLPSDERLPTEPMPSDPRELRQLLAKSGEVMVVEDTEAVSLDGASVRLFPGQTAHIASIPSDSTPDERQSIHRQLDQWPELQCLFVDGELLFVDWSAVQSMSRAASA